MIEKLGGELRRWRVAALAFGGAQHVVDLIDNGPANGGRATTVFTVATGLFK